MGIKVPFVSFLPMERELDTQLRALQEAFLNRARKDIDVYVSGYTHFQQAQPILLSHWWT